MAKHLVEGVEPIRLSIDDTDAPPAPPSVTPSFIAYNYATQAQETKSISQLAGQKQTPVGDEDKK